VGVCAFAGRFRAWADVRQNAYLVRPPAGNATVRAALSRQSKSKGRYVIWSKSVLSVLAFVFLTVLANAQCASASTPICPTPPIAPHLRHDWANCSPIIYYVSIGYCWWKRNTNSWKRKYSAVKQLNLRIIKVLGINLYDHQSCQSTFGHKDICYKNTHQLYNQAIINPLTIIHWPSWITNSRFNSRGLQPCVCWGFPRHISDCVIDGNANVTKDDTNPETSFFLWSTKSSRSGFSCSLVQQTFRTQSIEVDFRYVDIRYSDFKETDY